LDTCSRSNTRDLAQKYLEPPIKKVQLSPLCNIGGAIGEIKKKGQRAELLSEDEGALIVAKIDLVTLATPFDECVCIKPV
jgi:hypothetical protein